MKLKNIVIVAILLFALVAYIFGFEIPKSEKTISEAKPFYRVAKGQISKIEINAANSAFKLVNKDPQKAAVTDQTEDQLRKMNAIESNKWEIDGLIYNQVDGSTLASVINQLDAFALGSSLPSSELDQDLSLYGLVKPEVTLVVDRLDQYGNTKALKFEFGKKSDFLGKRYLRYTRSDNSSDIFLVDDMLFFAVNKEVKDFRKKDPVTFADSEFVKINIAEQKKSSKIQLEKKPSSIPGQAAERWKIISTKVISADDLKVADLLRNLKAFKVKEFYEGDSSKPIQADFEHPDLEIELVNKDQTKTSLIFKLVNKQDEQNQKTYFQLSNTPDIFEAESNTLKSVVADEATFRQTKFFQIDADDVLNFELKTATGPAIKGEKKDLKWSVDTKEGDEVFIRQWLLDLKDLSATSFPAEELDYGFASPTYQLTIQVGSVLGADDSKPIERKLVVGAVEKSVDGKAKSYYAAVDDLSEPFIISAESLEKITPKEEVLAKIPTAIPTAEPTVTPTISPTIAG